MRRISGSCTTSRRNGLRYIGEKEEVAALLTRVSQYLYDRGRWRKGPCWERRHLEHDLERGVTRNDSATSKGGYDEAREDIALEVLGLRQEVLRGEAFPDTIEEHGVTRSDIHAAGRSQLELSKLRREVSGEEHPDTISSMAELLTTYHAQGKVLTRRRRSTWKCWIYDKEVLGRKHPDTIESMASLATTFHAQG
ncbi:hypothetical protein PG991_014957, partial [Apiospora marii]